MFIDSAQIYVKAGNGGNGAVSFRREKYVPAGGPDGGDGGKGGDIILEVDEGIRTLGNFRYKKHYKAPAGIDGSGANKTGPGGEDFVLMVPPGTIIRDSESGRIIGDLTRPGERKIVAKGGKGGKGNQNFATSTRQAPNFAKSGQPGEDRWIQIELKLIADVGLIGFPNVGKSTILSMVSAAKPKIANYHFTTLHPNLGVIELDNQNGFVAADIPGLIEGAHEGVGLGHEFLKHVERTRLLIHVVDVAGAEGRDPVDDFGKINKELAEYSSVLASKPQVVAANKMDITGAEENLFIFKEEMESRGYRVFPVSAATGKGLKELMYHTAKRLGQIPETGRLYNEGEEEVIITLKKETLFEVSREEDVYLVKGKWIKGIVDSTNFSDNESLQYFQRVLKNKGVIDALENAGIQEGDTVKIYDIEFDYVK